MKVSRWGSKSESVLPLCAALLLVLAYVPRGQGQAAPTATNTRATISVGGEYSDYQADYGKRKLGGYTITADYDRTPRYSLEFQARVLRMNQEVDTHQTTFLIGPRVTYRRRWFNPYAKLLIGDGKFHFPYNYAEGSYFVLAPGVGLDVHLGNSRYTIRAINFEYQSWPNFSFGGLNSHGISTGISVRVY